MILCLWILWQKDYGQFSSGSAEKNNSNQTRIMSTEYQSCSNFKLFMDGDEDRFEMAGFGAHPATHICTDIVRSRGLDKMQSRVWSFVIQFYTIYSLLKLVTLLSGFQNCIGKARDFCLWSLICYRYIHWYIALMQKMWRLMYWIHQLMRTMIKFMFS